ncbi:MAG: hypothetical protein QOI38_2469 [Sphingomonadales bacterium]|jgi:hypothetical protein|nr:hypothetical protein [Sphingomonadales bacterium]
MSRIVRHVAGSRETGTAAPGAIAGMALALAEYARSRGLAVVSMKASRIRNSDTKHLVLRDARNRRWNIRVSDHFCPEKTGHERPHFDLVSFDGSSGFEFAIGHVSKIAAGDVPWAPPQRTPQRKKRR